MWIVDHPGTGSVTGHKRVTNPADDPVTFGLSVIRLEPAPREFAL